MAALGPSSVFWIITLILHAPLSNGQTVDQLKSFGEQFGVAVLDGLLQSSQNKFYKNAIDQQIRYFDTIDPNYANYLRSLPQDAIISSIRQASGPSSFSGNPWLDVLTKNGFSVAVPQASEPKAESRSEVTQLLSSVLGGILRQVQQGRGPDAKFASLLPRGEETTNPLLPGANSLILPQPNTDLLQLQQLLALGNADPSALAARLNSKRLQLGNDVNGTKNTSTETTDNASGSETTLETVSGTPLSTIVTATGSTTKFKSAEKPRSTSKEKLTGRSRLDEINQMAVDILRRRRIQMNEFQKLSVHSTPTAGPNFTRFQRPIERTTKVTPAPLPNTTISRRRTTVRTTTGQTATTAQRNLANAQSSAQQPFAIASHVQPANQQQNAWLAPTPAFFQQQSLGVQPLISMQQFQPFPGGFQPQTFAERGLGFSAPAGNVIKGQAGFTNALSNSGGIQTFPFFGAEVGDQRTSARDLSGQLRVPNNFNSGNILGGRAALCNVSAAQAVSELLPSLPDGRYVGQGFRWPFQGVNGNTDGGFVFGYPEYSPPVPKEALAPVRSTNGQVFYVPKGVYRVKSTDTYGDGSLELPNAENPLSFLHHLVGGTSQKGQNVSDVSGVYLPMPFGMRSLHIQLMQNNVQDQKDTFGIGQQTLLQAGQRQRRPDALGDQSQGDISKMIKELASMPASRLKNMLDTTLTNAQFSKRLGVNLARLLTGSLRQTPQTSNQPDAGVGAVMQDKSQIQGTGLFVDVPGMQSPMYFGGFSRQLNQDDRLLV